MQQSDVIYKRSSETVPEQFFWLVFGCFLELHILESEYNMPHVKYQFQPLCPFISDLGQTKSTFCVRDGGTLISIEKVEKHFSFKEIGVASTIKCGI